MRLPKPVRDNLFFLLAETSSQVGNLQVCLDTSSPSVAQRILDRRGYAYNLKMRIHDGCLHEVHQTKSKATLDTYSLRAAEAIASELERMTGLAHDCVRHLSGRKRRSIFETLSATKILDDVLDGIQLTRVGLEDDQTDTALRIGAVARRVSKKYEAFFHKESRVLKKAKHSVDAISALFVAQRFSEMGDVLLDISEAILSARLGHPLHMDRFRFLETAFEQLGLDNAEVESIAPKPSPVPVCRGSPTATKAATWAIFKDGEKKKLKEERASVESWHEIFPGLAPQILSYQKRGPNASLLIEHLPGFTFEHVLLAGSQELLESSTKQLSRTLKAVWRETKRPKRVSARHMAQLRKRLDDVREIHAEFGRGRGRVCREQTRSLDQLVDAAEELEKKFPAPFSVYIHGDFNLDNIIFEPAEKRINFVDLHRVLLFRLPARCVGVPGFELPLAGAGCPHPKSDHIRGPQVLRAGCPVRRPQR